MVTSPKIGRLRSLLKILYKVICNITKKNVSRYFTLPYVRSYNKIINNVLCLLNKKLRKMKKRNSVSFRDRSYTNIIACHS